MPFVWLIGLLISLYTWVVVVGVVLNWLVTFNVINSNNTFVRQVYSFCSALTEPALKRIRGFVRPVNGVDLSPLVLILGLWLLRACLTWYISPLLYRAGL